MAKKQRRKASVHSAGKTTEAELLAAARALHADPSLAMPACEGGCVLFSPVAAARRGILKAHAARDDEAKLQRLASGGNDLARAYAATILLVHQEKIPYVAELRLGGENVPYVLRGKAKPLYLAGLQHHDDRALRLLSVATWAKSRRMHFFSANRGIVCTGRSNAPPRDFVEEEAADLELSETSPGKFACGHEGDAVVVEWQAAGVELKRCAACAAEGSMLRDLLRHMAGPERRAGFRVRVDLAPIAGVAVDVASPLDVATSDRYLAGAMDDAAVLEAGRAARLSELRRLGRRLYVAGTTSYGDDARAFADALNASEAERRAIDAALAAEEGAVIVDRPTSARVLAELWPKHGRTMLAAAAGHAATAEALHKESVTPEEAADLVRRAAREGSARSVSEGLPAYASLPVAAAAADAIARAYRASGKDAAVRVALERASQGRAKGVALAALLELDAAKGQEWRFAGADHDVAAGARSAMQGILKGPAERYHEALLEASRRAGETATFAPKG